MRNKTISCLFIAVESPQILNPNSDSIGWVSLCYLRWLPNTSEEIGSKNGRISG